VLKFYPDDWFRVRFIGSDLSMYCGLHEEGVSALNWIRSILGMDRHFAYIRGIQSFHFGPNVEYKLSVGPQTNCSTLAREHVNF